MSKDEYSIPEASVVAVEEDRLKVDVARIESLIAEGGIKHRMKLDSAESKQRMELRAAEFNQDLKMREADWIINHPEEHQAMVNKEQYEKDCQVDREIRKSRNDAETRILLEDLHAREFKENVKVAGASFIGVGIGLCMYASI